jgi:hypothetical protein
LSLGGLDLIGPVQLGGGEVIVDLADIELEVFDRLEDRSGLDRGSMRGEALQGASESVIVEWLGRQVVGVGQVDGAGPIPDAEEGLGRSSRLATRISTRVPSGTSPSQGTIRSMEAARSSRSR